ncbi:MAG: hypothetical protein NVSMB33_10220 [Ktedonobacteraceae bacterium]
MKQQHILILLLLLLTNLAACSPGHLGSNEIAFLRNGQLWTIDPDGNNAFAIATDNTPIISYGWSPTHQLLTFRTLDTNFAKTAVGKHIFSSLVTELPGDLPSTLNTIGIDGGSATSIIFSNSNLRFSNAWWNSIGNRLIYRQTPATSISSSSPNSTLWWLSQNDQPGGIARKLLPSTFSIPSIDANSSMAIGNNQAGMFTTVLADNNIHYIQQGILPGHPLFASLERVLWQPAHQQPEILFALSTSSQLGSFNAKPEFQLVLRNMQGQITQLATCACTQFAWSPDGNAILYSTGSTYTIRSIEHSSSFTFSAEDNSVPYWSPDSQFLLLDGLHTLTLVQVASRKQQTLLSDTNSSSSESTILPAVNALLQPLANSLWASDSRQFLFLTRGRLLWQGKSLASGKGLYTVSINDHGQVQSNPHVVDTGHDTQAGWTYEDANTSFLF